MAKNTFKVAGITTHGGNTKVRFTDDLVRRIKQFSKGGASRIDLIDLPSEMTKIEALKYLLTQEQFKSPSDQASINEALEDRSKVKTEVKVKTSVKPSLENIKARAKKVTTSVETKETV